MAIKQTTYYQCEMCGKKSAHSPLPPHSGWMGIYVMTHKEGQTEHFWSHSNLDQCNQHFCPKCYTVVVSATNEEYLEGCDPV